MFILLSYSGYFYKWEQNVENEYKELTATSLALIHT